MAQVAVRPLRQHRARRRLGDERLQLFSGLVPVDEKDQPRADVFKKLCELLVAPRDEGAIRQEEHVFFEPARPSRARVVPGHRELAQHSLQERQALHVDVPTLDDGTQSLDFDDQHVRVGRPEVVLDHETLARPGGRRTKAGVIELELGGPVHPAHEGSDERPVGRRESEDVRPVEVLGCDARLEALEGRMDVDTQAVEAVPRGVHRRHRRELARRKVVAVERFGLVLMQGLEAVLPRLASAIPLGETDRGHHAPEIRLESERGSRAAWGCGTHHRRPPASRRRRRNQGSRLRSRIGVARRRGPAPWLRARRRERRRPGGRSGST